MDPRQPDGDTRTHESGFGALWSSDGVTRSLAPTATGIPADLPFLFAAGQPFGPYRIVRPIGKGGMGQVYEAEEIDSGRRVAIKILSRGIGDDEERERFLQEGRLAASLSHPNTVYVFGTTEVQGFPVIAMELAPSGTLKDLVVSGEVLPPAQAVDAVLQVIAGLEAAASIGILHRDIKPSNCFVARDGRVLVGDFGLSIATLARGAADTGLILGTPGFASPEQLLGAALDLRSDIYSVGATLYYLLAGKPPFDDPDLKTMMTRVATEAPPAIALSRPDLPSRLASAVARSLARKPGDRFASYAALRSALEPFRSASLTPAPPMRRFLAGAIDSYAASIPVIPINMYLGATVLDVTNARIMLLAMLPAIVVAIAYYTLLEGRFGCGAGKAMFNLRVVDARDSVPGPRRALVRALVFVMPAEIARIVLAYGAWPFVHAGRASDPVAQTLLAVSTVGVALVVLAVQFSMARRRNGYAALQDFASGTHVVVRPRSMDVRKSVQRAARGAGTAFDGDRVGPYLVPRGSFDRARAAAPLVVEGFDDRLRRPVWVELFRAGADAVPPWRRDLGRSGRTRWLSGRRQAGDCWDAYEAVDGVAFAAAIAQPQPWSRVRHWLFDLASEIAAGLVDKSLPPLAIDRIWIGDDDRARLLDWPAPSLSPAAGAAALIRDVDLRDAQRFLYGVAMAALRGVAPARAQNEAPAVPLPLPGRAFLLSLQSAAFATPAALAATAADVLRGPTHLTRGRRAGQIAICAFLPVIMPIAVVGSLRTQQRAQTVDPAAFEYNACVSQLAAYAKQGEANLTPAQRANRESIEIYIAEHLQDEVREQSAFAQSFPIVTRARGDYALAARAVASHPTRTPEQITRADAAVARVLASSSQGLAQLRSPLAQWGLAMFMTAWTCLVVALTGVVGAAVARGGFTLRGIGAALVTSQGEPASRLRAVWRTLVAWSLVAPVLLLMRGGPRIQDTTVTIALAQTLPLVLLAAGAAWAIVHPTRSLQDRLAGTWIVPR